MDICGFFSWEAGFVLPDARTDTRSRANNSAATIRRRPIKMFAARIALLSVTKRGNPGIFMLNENNQRRQKMSIDRT